MSTTASTSVTTSTPSVGIHIHVKGCEKRCPAHSKPSRCQRRTSIDMQLSQVSRPAQRPARKAAEERLAQAELAAKSAEATGQSLSKQLAGIAQERDAALKEVASANAKVADLERGLAQAELAAKSAEATGQSLSKQLAGVAEERDAARKEVASANAKVADLERRLAPIPTLGSPFRDCPLCPEMVVAPAGRFTMGSPAGEPERIIGEVQVRVTIAQPFAVGKFAVTFAEWDACVADGGCKGYRPDDRRWGRDKRPVINVNWDDAKLYIDWLNAKTGKTYRLLSEAEREYVTRASKPTPFWWGAAITPKQANYNGTADPYKGGGTKGEYRGQTVPVDSFEANPWGLFNVHGNVWEWTEDCWNDSNQDNPGNGSARTTVDCGRRVLRGGSWDSGPQYLRAAGRYGVTTEFRSLGLGFRLARTLNP
jgi:formylglycine-generating enzyme required for sulfatase activity